MYLSVMLSAPGATLGGRHVLSWCKPNLITFSLVPRPCTPRERVGSGDEALSPRRPDIYTCIEQGLGTRLPLDGCGRAAETAKQSKNAKAQRPFK